MAYTTKHETELDSAEKMKAFIDELDQISGSAVLYGAAANYTGDRAQLCTLFGEDALETSVPWVTPEKYELFAKTPEKLYTVYVFAFRPLLFKMNVSSILNVSFRSL